MDRQKNSRLNVRVREDLKLWFKQYAEDRGGMTLILTEFLFDLKKREISQVQVCGRSDGESQESSRS